MSFARMKAVLSVSAFAFVAMFAARAARAQVTVTIQQDGSNVVASGSGTIDLVGLTGGGFVNLDGSVQGSDALVGVGSGGLDQLFTGITGPAAFGSDIVEIASSSTGEGFGVHGVSQYVFLPGGYVSGSSLSGTSTWDGTTLAALGLTPGMYVYTWDNGAAGDTFTVDIEAPAPPPAATPEPSSLALLGSGVLGLAGLVRRMKR